MVTGVVADTKLSKGYGKLATKLGASYNLYRATDAMDPLKDQNMVDDEVYVYFDTDPAFGSKSPSKFNSSIWYAALDRVAYDVEAFDYIADEDLNAWYLTELQPLRPTMAVRCNETVNVYRQTSLNQTSSYYGGYSPNSDLNLIMGKIPIAMLAGGRGDRSPGGLPDADRSPGMAVYIPDLDVEILINDTLITLTGHRYNIIMVERTALGYQLAVIYKGT